MRTRRDFFDGERQQIHRGIELGQFGAADVAFGEMVLQPATIFRLDNTECCLVQVIHAKQAVVLG
jgi:hypothetical protein